VQRPRRNSAFTLLELVIVMMVMGTLLAVTAPNLSRFLHHRSVVEEARRLVAVTRRAAAVASSQSCRTVVWLDTTSGEYGWRRMETFTEDAEELSFTLVEGIEMSVSPVPTEETCEVTFLPTGGVEGADDLVVAFRAGSAGDEARVEFDETRGLFEVTEGRADE
jgi:prepilin-type N-terminal cleavage/methylation domain-containing protein